MKPFSVGEIRKIVNGTLVKGSDDLIITGVTDIANFMQYKNTLFFVRNGREKHWNAVKRCLPCAVVTDSFAEALEHIDGCTVILVKNVEDAYWDLMRYYRNLFDIPVVAITGTTGKTTTKDMIIHILKQSYNVTGTEKTSNCLDKNRIYLFRIDESTDAAVFETAVSHPGVLAYDCRLFKPSIGIITNIGMDHMKGCKTMENYIKAKGEMLGGLGDNGTLIINADDENIKKLDIKSFKGRVITFGIKNPADFQGSDVKYGENGMEFSLLFNRMNYRVFVPGYGEHQVYNALASLAAVHELGIDIDTGIKRLRFFEKLPHHLQLMSGIGGCTIIDDTWNINPTSLKAAIEVLNNISNGRKKALIVGDIYELGNLSMAIHRQVGDMIVDMGGLDMLITIGSLAAEIAGRARERGFKGEIYNFQTIDGIYDLLKNKLDKDTIVLIKFSGLRDKSILSLIKRLKV